MKKYFHLPQKYIKNTKLIADRSLLLEYLPKKSVVAEVGSEYGLFAHEILTIAKPKSLNLIDIMITDQLKKRFSKEIKNGKVNVFEDDSVKVLKSFPDNYFDWVYIDSSHTYLQTKKELQISFEKVKKGGLICGHDYTHFSHVENMEYGVVRAVNEFCIKHNWEIKYLTNEAHRYISFVLKEIS